MIHLPELDTYTTKFTQCVFEPLHVIFHLRPNSRIVNYSPIHFDGLLARAVVSMATQGRLLQDAEEPYWIPLPLKTLWQSKEGLPLWAASTLQPLGNYVDDIYIRHKRNSEGFLHNKKKLVTRNGPWMERRLPTPVQVCDKYEAFCIGNAEHIEALLSQFAHIGKLRLGRVDKIEVIPTEFEEEQIWLKGYKLIKPLPIAAQLLEIWPCKPTLVGWTPPFWKPSLFSEGWAAGTFVNVFDWFKAV